MALVLKQLARGYNYVFNEVADERVKHYGMMSSPVMPALLIFFYLKFVLSWGPKLMEKRAPFELRKVMMIYNIVQVFANVFLAVECFRYLTLKFNLWCEPIDYSNAEFPIFLTRMTWYYFILKISDLLDTVFFVLRKKHSQITFLHLYHHSNMVAFTWIAVKYIAGGTAVLLGWNNTIVHSVMYFYYFLTALNPEYKKNISWKKQITHMQLVQFILNIVLYGQLILKNTCGFPYWIAYVIVAQNVLMVILFGNFYHKTYILRNRIKDQ